LKHILLIGANMKSILSVAFLVAVVIVSTPMRVWGGDVGADAALVKRQALAIPDLQKAAAAAARDKNAAIEVKPAAHQITITVVNSKQNDGTIVDRTAEAATIASAIAEATDNRPEFAQVMMIHVDYVKRQGSTSTVIHGVDFNKAADGTFQLHRS
jgi:hypothetical protein